MKARILLLVTFLHIPGAWAGDALLKVCVDGGIVSELSLDMLQAELTSHRIEFFSPHAGKQKHYGAFALKDVLHFMYQTNWLSDAYSHVAFTALDGYEAVAGLDVLHMDGGFLAFKDLDVERGWEPVGHKKVNPGPFLIVWTGKNQSTADNYPWPWQISAFNLLRFEDQYPAVIPKGAAPDSAVHRGYLTFRSRCLRCHSIDTEGGKIGPDLNAPKNVTTYRSEHMIKEMIKHASTYRHTQMPDHLDLSERQLDELYEYLRFQKR